MRALIFSLLVVCTVEGLAQPNARWSISPAPGASQNILAATSDSMGNWYFVLRENSFSPTPIERLFKVNRQGVVQWYRIMKFSIEEVAWSSSTKLAADKLGNIALVGRASLAGATHGFLQKLNSNGDPVFTKLFADSSSRTFYPRDVQFDHTNQVAMTGCAIVNGQQRMMLHRYGAGGELRFIRYYVNANYSETAGEFVRFDPIGNLFVGGSSYGSRLQPFFWSYTPSGTVRYARSLVVNPAVVARDGRTLSDGSFYAALGPTSNGGTSMGVIRLQPDGGTAWYRFKSFATGTIYATSFGLALNGNAIVVGSHSLTGNDNDSWRLFMVSGTGSTLTDRPMGGTTAFADYVYGVTSDTANNFYLAGTAGWGGTQAGRLQQVLPTGANGWATSLNPGSNWYPQGLIQDADGNFLTYGFKWNVGGSNGVATMLSNLVSLTAPGSELPAGGSLQITVNLASAGRVGGTTVNLSSNSGRLILPSSVKVLPGQTSVRFLARATAGDTAFATITASLGGTAKTLPITIVRG